MRCSSRGDRHVASKLSRSRVSCFVFCPSLCLPLCRTRARPRTPSHLALVNFKAVTPRTPYGTRRRRHESSADKTSRAVGCCSSRCWGRTRLKTGAARSRNDREGCYSCASKRENPVLHSARVISYFFTFPHVRLLSFFITVFLSISLFCIHVTTR